MLIYALETVEGSIFPKWFHIHLYVKIYIFKTNSRISSVYQPLLVISSGILESKGNPCKPSILKERKSGLAVVIR